MACRWRATSISLVLLSRMVSYYRGGGDFQDVLSLLLLGEMMKFVYFTCRWVETTVT